MYLKYTHTQYNRFRIEASLQRFEFKHVKHGCFNKKLLTIE